jgi:nuclear transport factor 2 (NTF2) superfamily protein
MSTLLVRAYAAYNARDVDRLLTMVSEDVDWPDGVGRLHGRDAVRAYWLEQWTRTRTHDQPMTFTHRPDGRIVVRISQIVRSLDGSLISTGSFDHVHRIAGEHIQRLDIEEVAALQ